MTKEISKKISKQFGRAIERLGDTQDNLIQRKIEEFEKKFNDDPNFISYIADGRICWTAKPDEIKSFLRQSLEECRADLVGRLRKKIKEKAYEMDYGGFVQAVLLDDIQKLLDEMK